MYERWKNEWQIEKEKKIGWAKKWVPGILSNRVGPRAFFPLANVSRPSI